MGPGSHNPLKPFGSDVKCSAVFDVEGRKHRVSQNPGPGEYDAHDAIKHTKPKAYEVIIGGKARPNKIQETPDPYDWKKPGRGGGNHGFGDKYKHVYNNNPGPGEYDVNESPLMARSKSALMTNSSTYQK